MYSASLNSIQVTNIFSYSRQSGAKCPIRTRHKCDVSYHHICCIWSFHPSLADSGSGYKNKAQRKCFEKMRCPPASPIHDYVINSVAQSETDKTSCSATSHYYIMHPKKSVYSLLWSWLCIMRWHQQFINSTVQAQSIHHKTFFILFPENLKHMHLYINTKWKMWYPCVFNKTKIYFTFFLSYVHVIITFKISQK